ncbi:hypothetical protein JX266_008971 [Neoarthrinium moseri]|nr:hypothetical protein JX266_008971 [Neoarthrinium moseri]
MATLSRAAAAAVKGPGSVVLALDTNANTNLSPHQRALALLQPLQPILAGLNHRNHNQFRGAQWWGSLGMLRRQLGKLVAELQEAARTSRSRPKSKSASSKAKRKRSNGLEEDDAAATAADDGPAEVRARWTRDQLVPGCYVAFSQLAADNQFATLGIVLLGALAQVHAACVQVVGGEQPVADEEGEADTRSTKTTKATAVPAGADRIMKKAASAKAVPGLGIGTVDAGEVVSREEIAAAARRGKDKADAGAAERRTEEAGSPPPKRKKREAGEAVSSSGASARLRAGLVEKGDKAAKEENAKAKKKKKAKKGDEFDALFSSLM